MISGSAENQAIVGKVILASSILMSMVVSNDQSSQHMIMMIRSLQMITHLPLYSIKFQGNVMNQFGIILPLLQFDFMDAFIDW